MILSSKFSLATIKIEYDFIVFAFPRCISINRTTFTFFSLLFDMYNNNLLKHSFVLVRSRNGYTSLTDKHTSDRNTLLCFSHMCHLMTIAYPILLSNELFSS